MRYVILLALAAVIFTSCKRWKPINENAANELQAVIDNKNNQLHPGASNKQIRKQWMELYNTCFKNDIFKNPNYLGLSNNYGIGTLIDPGSGEVIKSLSKIIPASDFNKFVDFNAAYVPICSSVTQKKFDFNILLDGIINNVGDADIAAALKKEKDATIVAGQWRQLNATVGDLSDYIDSSRAAGMDYFRRDANGKSVYLVSAVLEVSAFSARLNFASDWNAAINAKFQNADSLSVLLPNLKSALKIQKKGAKSMEVTCNATFIPLVVLSTKRKN